MSFTRGQRVCCINSKGWWNEMGLQDAGPHPVKGGVYTIAAIVAGDARGPLLGLVELGPPGIYIARCFRPVVERKTDISVFTKMLDLELT